MLVAAANPCPCGRGEDRSRLRLRALRRPALPGQAERRPRGPDRHPRRGRASRARRRSAARPGEPSAAVRERVCAARERQEARLGPGRCNAEMTPARGAGLRPQCRRGLAAGRSLRAPAAQRPRPRPGAAARPDRRRPRPGPRRSARSRWPRRCRCGGGTMAEPRACPECLRRSWLLAALGPYIEQIATGEVGSRSPELLRLSNEELVEVAAPQGCRAAPGAGRGALGGQPARGAGAGELLGMLPPRRALSGVAARRRRRPLGVDRTRQPAAARRARAARGGDDRRRPPRHLLRPRDRARAGPRAGGGRDGRRQRPRLRDRRLRPPRRPRRRPDDRRARLRPRHRLPGRRTARSGGGSAKPAW